MLFVAGFVGLSTGGSASRTPEFLLSSDLLMRFLASDFDGGLRAALLVRAWRSGLRRRGGVLLGRRSFLSFEEFGKITFLERSRSGELSADESREDFAGGSGRQRVFLDFFTTSYDISSV